MFSSIRAAIWLPVNEFMCRVLSRIFVKRSE
jgi:hypothetical protein